MKFALNGALTIGTWDGANIEMALSMGEEQMFVFGLRADEVARVRDAGYDPGACIARDGRLAAVIEALERGDFSPAEPHRYHTLTHALRHDDRYLLCADFAGYLRAQNEVDALYRQPHAWAARALRNVAAMGPFSVDRTIAQYAAQVWS
jgi:starch phosphorylase